MAMQQKQLKIFLFFFVVTTTVNSQNAINTKVVTGELKMNFPAVYFKANSTDYAFMPYTTDSCFKYMAAHLNYITSFVIWRDSFETNQLTSKRIKKIMTDLGKYIPPIKIKIHNMGKEQKIARSTINQADSVRVKFFISLNSVFDINETNIPVVNNTSTKKSHIDHPRVWCINCWRKGRFRKEYRRLHVK